MTGTPASQGLKLFHNMHIEQQRKLKLTYLIIFCMRNVLIKIIVDDERDKNEEVPTIKMQLKLLF